jgi:hypothetical protein
MLGDLRPIRRNSMPNSYLPSDGSEGNRLKPESFPLRADCFSMANKANMPEMQPSNLSLQHRDPHSVDDAPTNERSPLWQVRHIFDPYRGDEPRFVTNDELLWALGYPVQVSVSDDLPRPRQQRPAPDSTVRSL